MSRRRVVVTGLGAVSPIGHDLATIEENLRNGKNGIGPISYYPTEDRGVCLAAELADIDLTEYISAKELKRMDKVSALGVIAGRKAFEDSGLSAEEIKDNPRVDVRVSSGIGGIITIEEETEKGHRRGFDRISPFFIPKVIGNMTSARISIDLGINGGSYCPVTACAGGTNAVGEGFRAIKDGYTDISFVGGSESTINSLAVGSFTAMKALSESRDPERASIPFDVDRHGFVMGEGAAVLVLEELDRALARGAKIYGEVVGCGVTSDAFHITAPNEEGKWAAMAMTMAMEEAGLKPEEITTINAHGTSTNLNDLSETRAVKLAFGDAYKDVLVSSTKSMTGHLLGAAGAFEALICSLQLSKDFIAPTINLRNQDPECDLNVVANEVLETRVDAVMSNSLGFGGHNFSILMKRWED